MTHALAILIVEDEMLLAMDIEAMVEDSGHQVVGEAASVSEVEGLSHAIDPQLALVDIHLDHDSDGFEVCGIIRKRWPDALVVFITANVAKIPHDFCGAHGVIAKPFSQAGVKTALSYLAQGVHAPPPKGPRPASFTASPTLERRWAAH